MNISTQAKLISTALVAVAIAAPIAHGESDGTLIYRANQKAAASSPSGYPPLKSGTALNEYQQKIRARTPSEQSPTASSSSFDWADAGIGAAVVAGLGMLGLGGFLALRKRHVLAQLDV